MKTIIATLATLLSLPLLCGAGIQTGPNAGANPATQAEVNAGVNAINPVTPATLAGWVGVASLSLNVIYVDAVSGSDTTGTGSSSRPYATLTKAQTIATNGQTIYAVRGTFSESGLGKQGVNWYFNDGTFLSGSSAIPFFLGATNSTTSLYISGRLTHTNDLVTLYGATNCFALIDVKEGQIATAAGVVFETAAYNGLNFSNQIYYSCDKLSGGMTFRTTTGTYSNVVNEFYVSARQSLSMKPTSGSGSGSTNLFFSFTAPKFNAVNASSGFFGTSNCVLVTSQNFTKTGSALTAVAPGYVFNITALTTNDFNTNATGLRGNIQILR